MQNQVTNQNTVWHEPTVYRANRERLNAHRSAILWFTGLSGSGKSTLSHAIEDKLYKQGVRTYVLDGDNIRKGLCKDLGFFRCGSQGKYPPHRRGVAADAGSRTHGDDGIHLAVSQGS